MTPKAEMNVPEVRAAFGEQTAARARTALAVLGTGTLASIFGWMFLGLELFAASAWWISGDFNERMGEPWVVIAFAAALALIAAGRLLARWSRSLERRALGHLADRVHLVHVNPG